MSWPRSSILVGIGPDEDMLLHSVRHPDKAERDVRRILSYRQAGNHSGVNIR